jgi:site-specific DNA-methyltransferase (adenine-specific)
MKPSKVELINDNFQNFKRYNIPRAQLVIADIPYNLGKNAYASSTEWYIDGDNKNGESNKAGKQFFNTDANFNIAEYMHFCNKLLIKEPKERGKAPAMIVFCAFEQMQMVIDYGKKYGFENAYPLFFIKNYSSQVLKANMRIVGATEHAVVLYRDKLPKFNNNGKMIFNWMEWVRDNDTPKIHPTQKPIPLLKKLIGIFTDEGDVVIDPVAGSGTTLKAAAEMNRHAYGFEIDKKFYKLAQEKMISSIQMRFLFGQESIG